MVLLKTDMKYLIEFWSLVEREDEMFVLTHGVIRSRLTTETWKHDVAHFYTRKFLISGFIEGIDYVLMPSNKSSNF